MEELIDRFFSNYYFKRGFWLFVIGTAPLLLAALFLSKHSNPVGLGILFFFTFPVALIYIAVGAWQVLFGKKD